MVEKSGVCREVGAVDESGWIEVCLFGSPVDGYGIRIDGMDDFFGDIPGLDAGIFVGEDATVHGAGRGFVGNAGMGREMCAHGVHESRLYGCLHEAGAFGAVRVGDDSEDFRAAAGDFLCGDVAGGGVVPAGLEVEEPVREAGGAFAVRFEAEGVEGVALRIGFGFVPGFGGVEDAGRVRVEFPGAAVVGSDQEVGRPWGRVLRCRRVVPISSCGRPGADPGCASSR